MPSSTAPVALVTGAARRLGGAIAEALHADGYNVCLHYHRSAAAAEALAASLNATRPNSAVAAHADLSATATGAAAAPKGVAEEAVSPASLSKRCEGLIGVCYSSWGRCDALVNNASGYYPTPLLRPSSDGGDGSSTEDVEAAAADLFGSNAIAPYYLIKVFAQRIADLPAEARASNYAVVNMVDAMTAQPLLGFTMYTMAKGALEGLTRSAALELAPLRIRVNGVGPGLSVLADDMPSSVREEYRRKVPLYQRESTAAEIGDAVLFLCSDKSKYITGTFVNVDGGWSLTRA
ncbi:pteridine reductase 1 [Novymonas esmeraldas]|uniref:Pteridine reductase 1 n=1 Tax=Novymonas esmeraldas TaxID=1808958 RepID=A0AAW0EQT0_9TRYP